jgi:hypothetical protein
MIASHTVTENPYAAESPYVNPSVNQVKSTYSSVKSLSGDAAFLSRENASLIAAAGAIPLVYPKKNVTLRAKGHPALKTHVIPILKRYTIVAPPIPPAIYI